MIFVCLGTKRFQFNRLLKQIDILIENGEIKDDVFAQIGTSTYIPKNFSHVEFLTPNEYQRKIDKSNLVITHGGTGAIIKALKANKQVIAVPRRAKLGEHSDDHQLQIVEFFTKLNYIRRVDDVEDLGSVLNLTQKKPLKYTFQSEGKVIEIIDDFIQQNKHH